MDESEVRYAVILTSVADGVIATDVDGRVTFMNPAAEALTGWTLQESRGVAVEQVYVRIDESSRELLENPVHCALRQKAAVFLSSASLISRNNEITPIDDGAAPLVTKEGEVIGAVVTFRNIRDRRLAEAAWRRAEEQARQMQINAQEEERSRIARELHDDVSQQLAAVSISISNLTRRFPEHDRDTRDQSQRLQQAISALAKSIRNLSHELHSPVLEHFGIAAALQSYCSEFTSLTHIAVSVQAEEAFDDLSPTTALCIYRIMQEALGNIAKHSEGRQAAVRLVRSNGSVQLTIADSGTGLSPAQAEGLGLVSMKERTRLLNGTFHIESSPNGGTTLTVSIPT